jgi:hypothetical protein
MVHVMLMDVFHTLGLKLGLGLGLGLGVGLGLGLHVMVMHVFHACSVETEFTVPNGKRSEQPRGMPLVTRM